MDCRWRIYIYTGRVSKGKGRQTQHFTAVYKNVEAWFEWQTGQDGHSRHSPAGTSEQRPNGIFPPVDVVRMLSGSITSHVSLGGFLFTQKMGFFSVNKEVFSYRN